MRCSRTGAGLGSSEMVAVVGSSAMGVVLGFSEIGSASRSSDSTILPTFLISPANQSGYVRESTAEGGMTRKIPASRSWSDAWAEAEGRQIDACGSITYGVFAGQ